MNGSSYTSLNFNAPRDEKVVALRMTHKWQGFGLFLALICRLGEASGYKCVRDYDLVAFDLQCDVAVIKSIIEDFGLFAFTEDGKYFYSESFNERMRLREEKSSKARDAANKRWGNRPVKNAEREGEKCESDADAMQTQCGIGATVMQEKKRKEKKSKVNINTPNGVFAQSDCKSLWADAPQPKQECALTDFVIPLTGESKFFVPRTDYEKWKTLFPGVDIDQELRKMHAWCDANPAQKKTPRGVRSFIVRWLGRAQDSGKGARGQPAAAKAPSWARGQFDESKYEKPYQPPDPSIYE